MKSVTAYPLFPAFVAAWFAALFSLSSLAMGGPNLGRVVAALHLHLLVSAAAPPLGMTARALIAAGLAVAGAALGYGIARAIVRARQRAADLRAAREAEVTVRLRDLHPDAPVRRPISAHDELGDAGEVDEAAALDMQSLRASLAAGHDTDIALPEFLEPAAEEADPKEVSAAEPEPPAAPVPPAPFDLPAGEAAARIASAAPGDLSPVELLERLAIAMQRRLDRRAAAGEEGLPRPAESGADPLPAATPADDADETEKALREALAALQKMTGTA